MISACDSEDSVCGRVQWNLVQMSSSVCTCAAVQSSVGSPSVSWSDCRRKRVRALRRKGVQPQAKLMQRQAQRRVPLFLELCIPGCRLRGHDMMA